MTIDELGPGVVFAGHRIEATLGEGGMGVVFRARQLRLDRTVALKVIAPQWTSDVGYRQLFEREARLAASIDDPHVIDVYEAGEADGRLYLTTRFVEGVDVKELLRSEGPLPARRAAEIVAQAAEGLDAAHGRGLVHRDVKPQNLLLARRDGHDHVYLTDFGLTKRQDATTLSVTKGRVGTPAYMAPEQMRGERVDARADVYSLGCVLYELLTRVVPYARPNLPPVREFAAEVPAKFDEIIARALAESPDDRYPSAGDLGLAAFAAAQGGAVGRVERSVALGDAAPGNSPPLPLAFVRREELSHLREKLLGAGDGAVGVGARPFGLFGPGGIGKSVLAAALACDQAVTRQFADGVFWVTVGERGDLVAAQIDLLERLGEARPKLRSATQGVALLRQALADRRCLVVVDDVCSGAAAAAFCATGPCGRVLYTTRDPGVLRAVSAHVELVDVLPVAAARQLLTNLTRVDVLPAEAERILEATGGVALALALVGAAIGSGGRSWQQVADELDRGDETFLHHSYANTFKAMQIAIAALTDEDAEAYRSLAVYPFDTLVSTDAVARLWTHLFDLSPEQTRARLASLAVRKLLALGRGGLGFHDLQREFLLLHTSDLSLLHADLLAAYRTLLPHPDDPWAELPPREPYIWDHLLFHLHGAGDGAGVIALVCDLGYLALRSFRSGPYAAESDLRQAALLYPDQQTIAWLRRLFTQWGHLFADQPTVGDLAATLASRTHDAPVPLIADRLDALLPDCFLVVQWGLPSAPQAQTRVLEGHTDSVSTVVFSPDGSRLASGGSDGVVRLWDPTSGQATNTLVGRPGIHSPVAFSPDGRRLASGGSDGTVRLWDPATGQVTNNLEGHRSDVYAVAFSPDGRQLASGDRDGVVRLWDPATGRPTNTLEGHTETVWGLAFSPDGLRLASGGSDGVVRLWDPATGRPTKTLEGHTNTVSTVAFSPDGRWVASGDSDGMVRLWDPATGQATATFSAHTDQVAGADPDDVSGITFSRDSRQLVTANFDGTVRLWDLTSGQPSTILVDQTHCVNGMALSRDGCRIATACGDGTVRLWEPYGGRPTRTLDRHTSGVWRVAVSPDGRQLATASFDRTVRLWDPATGKPTTTLEGHTNAVTGVAFSPDGQKLASVDADGTVRLWDPATGQPTTTLTAGPLAFAVAFSPDGRQIAIGSGMTVCVWELGGGQRTAALEGHTHFVRAVAFSPDGRQLATADFEGTVRLWDPGTGQPTATLQGDSAFAMALSPDGRRLATACRDGTLRLWDPATGQPIKTIEGHAGKVMGAAFSPDGRRLATGGDDGVVRLWDIHSNSPVARLKLGVRIHALAWGPRGITIAAQAAVVQLSVRDYASSA